MRKGSHCSDEHKRKLSELKMGTRLSETHKQAIRDGHARRRARVAEMERRLVELGEEV